MKDFKNKVVAITGAASGIGKALAHEFSRLGAKLALSDLNKDALLSVADECSSLGCPQVMTTQIDVADREQVELWAKDIHDKFSHIHVIINNAGVALSASIESMEYEDFERVMGINFWGVVYGTKAFLPYLNQSEEAHVVNVSSLFGLLSIPNQSAYNSAKFGVRAFTQCLRMELALEKSSVHASFVCPGGIKTNIANSGVVKQLVGKSKTRTREEMLDEFNTLLARTSSEDAAKIIIKGMKKNKRQILVGKDATLFAFLLRFIPVSYQKILEKIA